MATLVMAAGLAGIAMRGSFAWAAGLQYGQLTMAVAEVIAAALALAALIRLCWAWASLRVGWL